MKWLADENFDNDILRGIRRRAVEFDVVRVQDIAEISGSADLAVLAWATANARVVLTHDVSTMIPALLAQNDAVRILLADFTRARIPPGQSGN